MLDISQQIKHIEKTAGILNNQRQQKKIKNKFEKRYEDFYEVLNNELQLLDPNDREEIKAKLENVSAAIKDNISKLS